MEGVDLASDEGEDFNRDNRTNQLHVKEAGQLPPLVVPLPLLQSSSVTFTPGTLQTLGDLWHISVTIDVTAEEADALTTPVTRHM